MQLKHTKTRYSDNFAYHANDSVIGEQLTQYGEYQQREINLLSNLIKQDVFELQNYLVLCNYKESSCIRHYLNTIMLFVLKGVITHAKTNFLACISNMNQSER